MSQEQNQIEEEEDDSPSTGWLVTFSDLLSLLLCFFVVLLSVADFDPIKYKIYMVFKWKYKIRDYEMIGDNILKYLNNIMCLSHNIYYVN